MRVSSTMGACAGAVAGLAVAVAGYHVCASAPEPPTARIASVSPGPNPAVPPRPLVRFAKCTPPAKLKRGMCVTRIERTKVVYDLPPRG